MTGAKLAALVCKHMRAVLRAHRRALKNNMEYCARTRVPPHDAGSEMLVRVAVTLDGDEM